MTSELSSLQTGSRFQLTLLFVDLSHSTAISQAMEPEHYAEVMAELRIIWRQVVQKHNGYLARIQGDGALIVFGYPQSTEEDGRRAAEAALEIHELTGMIEHSYLPPKFLPIRMHSGIHAGTVLMSTGDIERGRFDLSGQIPNTAAHLAAAAGPGQILTSMAVLGPHANYFSLGKFDWRGNSSAPKDLCVVTGRSNIHSRFDSTKRRGLTPLLGRENLLAQIDEFLGQTSQGATFAMRCLVLVGVAGLGKTRLINETLQKHSEDSLTYLYGSCEGHSAIEALQPFAQMLQSQSEASHARLVGTRLRQVSDFLSFFSAHPAKSQLVIVIDDWQWADDASRQLVGALLSQPDGPRLLLAARPQDNDDPWIQDASQVNLAPLSEQQTALAVRKWIPHADPFLCTNIHLYSGGVPLFIEELCHSATVVDLKKVIGGFGITQSWLGSLVASRLARQRAEVQELIRICAVIGNAVPLWLLEATTNQSLPPNLLIELEDADFLYPIYQNGRVTSLLFKHGITWDAVYKGIGFTDRSLLHSRILSAVLSRQINSTVEEDVTELLAHHSRGAGDWPKAAQYAEASGDRSVATFALDLAHMQYKTALEALDRIPRRNHQQSLTWCKVAGKLALTSIFDPLCLGNDLSVFEAAVQLATELDDASALAQAKYWLGYLQYGLGHLRSAEATVRAAITIAKQASLPSLMGPFEATLGQILVASCQYEEGLELLDKALEAKKQRTGQLKGSAAMGVAYSLAVSGFAYADRGQFQEAQTRFDEALDLLAGTTHPVGNSVRNFICISYIWQENWEAAEKIAIESKKIAENSRTLLLLASSRGLLDYVLWATGKDPSGLDRFKETLVWMDDHHCGFYTSLYFGLLAHACAREGQIAQARQYAVRVALLRNEGETLGEAMACRAMAFLAANRNNHKLAQRWLTRADRSALVRKSEREQLLNSLMKAQISVA